MIDPVKAASAIEILERQLDPAASEALPRLVSDLHEALLVEARRLSPAGPVTEDDLYVAFKRLVARGRGSHQLADAQTVISQALRKTGFSNGCPTSWP